MRLAIVAPIGSFVRPGMRALMRGAAIAAAAATVACGGGGGGGIAPTTPPGPTTPTVSLATSPAALTCQTGEQVTLSASLTPAQTGATFTFTAGNAGVTVTASGQTATIRCVTAGSSSVVVTAGGQTVTVPVAIAATPINISVSMEASSLSVPVGGTQPITVRVTATPAGTSTAFRCRSLAPAVLAVDSLTCAARGVAAGSAAVSAFSVVAPTVSAQLTFTVVAPSAAIRTWVATRGGVLGDTTVRGFVNGLWGSSPTNVFAVASESSTSGEIWRYDGTRWTSSRANGGVTLFGVSGSSASDVYAVGDRGTALRFDGTTWTTVPTGTVAALRDVFALGPRLAYAVGDSGAVFRLDAAGATRLNVGTTATLDAVWASSTTNIYVAGDSGIVLRFDGTTWRRTTTPVPEYFDGLWGTATGAVFAASSSGRIYQVQSGAPVQAATFPFGFTGLSGGAANDVYAVGFGVARFDGTSWSEVATPYPNALFQSVFTTGGTAFVGGSTGLTMVRRGTSAPWTTLGVRIEWFGAAPISASSALLVGSLGATCRWDGTTCTAVPTSTARSLFGAWGDGSGNAIGVGDGVILQFGAGVWRTVRTDVGTLLGVSGVSASSAYAVGDRIFRLEGTSWTEMSKPTNNTLNAVWAASSTTARAVGARGTLLRLENGTWRTESLLGRTDDLLSVWGADTTNVFVGSRAGVVFRYDGAQWAAQSTPSQCSVWGLWGASAADVYAATACGEVLRYDGQRWTLQTQGPTNLWAVTGLSGGGGVAVGGNHLVLRGSSTASSVGQVAIRLPVRSSGDAQRRLSRAAERGARVSPARGTLRQRER